jgi:hypothetical protein
MPVNPYVVPVEGRGETKRFKIRAEVKQNVSKTGQSGA